MIDDELLALLKLLNMAGSFLLPVPTSKPAVSGLGRGVGLARYLFYIQELPIIGKALKDFTTSRD